MATPVNAKNIRVTSVRNKKERSQSLTYNDFPQVDSNWPTFEIVEINRLRSLKCIPEQKM